MNNAALLSQLPAECQTLSSSPFQLFNFPFSTFQLFKKAVPHGAAFFNEKRNEMIIK